MPQGRFCNGSDIFYRHVESSFKQCAHLAGQYQALDPSGACSVLNIFLYFFRCVLVVRVAGHYQPDRVILNMGGNGYVFDHPLHFKDFICPDHKAKLGLVIFGGFIDNLDQVVFVGIVDLKLEEKPVDLGFRKRIRSFHLNGILSGQNHKRRAQSVFGSENRDSFFLHGLQQGGLGFWAGPVDFIGQNQLAENGALIKFESSISCLVLAHHVRA